MQNGRHGEIRWRYTIEGSRFTGRINRAYDLIAITTNVRVLRSATDITNLVGVKEIGECS